MSRKITLPEVSIKIMWKIIVRLKLMNRNYKFQTLSKTK
jgi:hypothetical protein